jgi:hypothetical protein
VFASRTGYTLTNILWLFYINLRYDIPQIPLKQLVILLKPWTSNRLFLKLNRFICQLLEKLMLSHCSSIPSLAHLMDTSNLLTPLLACEYWGFTYCSVCVLNLVPRDVTATLSLGRAAAWLYPGPPHSSHDAAPLEYMLFSQINKYWKTSSTPMTSFLY